ncbi:hypothetical protein LCGC14_2723260, partial [marine sediment metagenome]
TYIYIRVCKDANGQENGRDHHVANCTKNNTWRYATIKEIKAYDYNEGPVKEDTIVTEPQIEEKEPDTRTTKFLKDEYIVLTKSDCDSGSGIKLNYVFKQREDYRYIRPYLDTKGNSGNGHVHHPTDKSRYNDWRYATKAEGIIYERLGKPFDVLENNAYLDEKYPKEKTSDAFLKKPIQEKLPAAIDYGFNKGDIIVPVTHYGDTDWKNHWFVPGEIMELGGTSWKNSHLSKYNSFKEFAAKSKKHPHGNGMTSQSKFTMRHATKEEKRHFKMNGFGANAKDIIHHDVELLKPNDRPVVLAGVGCKEDPLGILGYEIALCNLSSSTYLITKFDGTFYNFSAIDKKNYSPDFSDDHVKKQLAERIWKLIKPPAFGIAGEWITDVSKLRPKLKIKSEHIVSVPLILIKER